MIFYVRCYRFNHIENMKLHIRTKRDPSKYGSMGHGHKVPREKLFAMMY